MRIGIVTFQRALNHGASLQMYGLYRTLKKMGHDVKVIDYISDHQSKATLKKRIADTLNVAHDRRKAEQYRKFREEFLGADITEPLAPDQLGVLNDRFDLFIAGSDQIWNNHIGFFEPFYFLCFVNDDRKKYSYAVSFNLKGVPESKEAAYTERLSSFMRFSVREPDGVEAVKKLTGRDAEIHIDPSLLLNTDEWLSCIKGVEVPSTDKYIVIYTVGKPVALVEKAKELAKKKGLKLFYMSDFYGHLDVKHLRGRGPLEFLAAIANAEYVFTNSFHGTAFSINFHRPFFTECQTQNRYNFRSESLMRKCGLFDRDLSNNPDALALADKPVDWERAEASLNEERRRSAEYFESIVSEVSSK